MSDKQQQTIEEMVNDIKFCLGKSIEECRAKQSCKHCLAEQFYNVGYRKQSEWISVDERLPERNGRYLTHCNIENQSLVCVLYYCKIGGFNEGTVTHWMPLPEAPKMKGAGNE